MHDGMPYDPIQGQRQRHAASEVPKIALFKVYVFRRLQWELANDHVKLILIEFELWQLPVPSQHRDSFHAVK